MARRYTPEQKAEILQILDDNFGNVQLTAAFIGMPERTLRDWKNRRKRQHIREFVDLPPEKNNRRRRQEDMEEEIHEYTHLRERLMDHINNLMETLTDDPDLAHLRVIALTRLLDRVIKLEALTAKEGEQVIRLEYKYPDGTIHDKPPWMDDDDEESTQLSDGKLPKNSITQGEWEP